MACVFQQWMHLDDDLYANDISGAFGCNPFSSRTSLLVEPSFREILDDQLWLHCKRFSPEGLGRDFYTKDFVQVPPDSFLDDVIISWDTTQSTPPIGNRVWLREVKNLEFWETADFKFDSDSFWLWVNRKPQNPPKVKILELFAGAFGGWKSATHHLASRCANNFDYQTVAVEHDLNAAIAYAIGHASALTKTSKNLPIDLFSRCKENWIVWGDVLDKNILKSLCHWQPHIVTLSPPCQPWSGAGRTKGLDVVDGMIFPQSLLMCRWLRPAIILIEEVAGFMNHIHKASVLKILPLIGYKICWQKIIDMKAHSLSSRNRWLCCAIRIFADLPMKTFLPWPIQTDLQSLSIRLNNLQHDQQLQPTTEAIRIASDPRFLRFHVKNPSREETLKHRIFEPGSNLPTFMAMYGRQHCLDESMFYKSGYLGFFVKDDSCPKNFRFWHPAEICFIHGATDNVYIDENYPNSWQHVGNSIGFPHALQLLIHAFQLLGLGDFSPFVAFQTFHAAKMSAEDHEMIRLDSGTLLCSPCDIPDDEFLRNAKQLERCKVMEFPEQCWLPKHGFVSFDHEMKIGDNLEPFSQITVPEPSPPDVSPTVEFQPVLKGFIQFENHRQSFWHSADIPTHVLEQIWKGQLRAHLYPNEDDRNQKDHFLQLIPSKQEQSRLEPHILQIICDGELSLLACPLNTPLCQLSVCRTFGENIFDQFGVLHSTCINSWDLLVLTRPLTCGNQLNDLTFTMAAVASTTISFCWNAALDHCCFCIRGTTPAPLVIQDAFSNALVQADLDFLHRQLTCEVHQEGITCTFVPTNNRGVAPEGAFRLGLAIGLSRSMLNQVISPSNCFIMIKWNGRILWHDQVHPSITIGFLLSILGFGLFPYTLDHRLNLVNKGKKCNPEHLVSVFPESSHCNAILFHVIPYLQGGGPGSKNQQRMLQQTALASVLLEHGYDLPWTTKTCDTLLSKFSLARIQAITAQPMSGEKLKAIHQLCTEADISLPVLSKPSSKAVSTIAPWSNSKKAKRSQVQLNPRDFMVCQGFFLNADGSPAPQLQELRPQASGIVLSTPQQAQSWIKEGQLISSDELGLLILGAVPETSLPFVEVTFPCKNANDQMVLLTAKLIQLGSKAIGFLKGPDKQIDSESCALIAITLCKEDWDQECWTDALHNTQSFLRRVISQENQSDSVLAMWGRSLRSGNSPASPAQALTIQMHATVLENKLEALLKQSGFNKLYMTPKLQHGETNPEYRIMWINGNLPRVTALSAQSGQCLGLIKGRLNQGYGLRFKACDFVDSWKKLFPQTDPPNLPQGNLKFKIEGLPFGCSQQMLIDWADSLNWSISPFRTLGPQCWMIKTGKVPPPGILMFNASPLLITPVQPKGSKSEKLITGPLPRQSTSEPLGNPDPWAQWKGPRPSPSSEPSQAAVRKVDGPTETRFQAQDDQINSLKAEISKLAVSQEKTAKATESRFNAVEQQVKQNASDIQSAMNQIRADIDQTLKSTIAKQSSMVDDRFKELKDLFVKTSTKRRTPSRGEEDMED